MDQRERRSGSPIPIDPFDPTISSLHTGDDAVIIEGENFRFRVGPKSLMEMRGESGRPKSFNLNTVPKPLPRLRNSGGTTACGNTFVCGDPMVQIRITLLPGLMGVAALTAAIELTSINKTAAKRCSDLEAMRTRVIVNLRTFW